MGNTIHVFEAVDGPDKKPKCGVCALFGSERFLKLMAVEHLVRHFANGDEEFAETRFDSDTATWADVHDELSTRSLFGGDGPRIVVVDHADKFVKENRDRLEDYVAGQHESSLLILVVDSWASNTRLYKAIDKSGLQIRCEAPTKSARSKKPDPAKTAKWLVERAKANYGFTLPKNGANLLIDLTDFDFGRMDQELQKLALYADDKGKLKEEQIGQVVGGWRTRTMWEAIDAAVAGDAGKAMDLLDQLLRSGEHPLALFGQLSWSLRRYGIATEIVLRQARTGRRPNLDDAVRQAGFRQWGGEIESSQGNLKQLGRARAKKILDWLLQADLALKRSHSKENRGRLVLEKLFVKMASELAAQPA